MPNENDLTCEDCMESVEWKCEDCIHCLHFKAPKEEDIA